MRSVSLISNTSGNFIRLKMSSPTMYIVLNHLQLQTLFKMQLKLNTDTSVVYQICCCPDKVSPWAIRTSSRDNSLMSSKSLFFTSLWCRLPCVQLDRSTD